MLKWSKILRIFIRNKDFELNLLRIFSWISFPWLAGWLAGRCAWPIFANFQLQKSGNHRFSSGKIAAVAFHNCARTQAPCQNGSERRTPCEKQLTQAPHFLNIFKRGRVLPYVSLLKFSKMFSKIIRGGDLRICTASHARISKNVWFLREKKAFYLYPNHR